jgi:hypothetical protein
MNTGNSLPYQLTMIESETAYIFLDASYSLMHRESGGRWKWHENTIAKPLHIALSIRETQDELLLPDFWDLSLRFHDLGT